MIGFAPNSVFYKSSTSIGLQNRELIPNEKKPQKNGFQIKKKTETLNNLKIAT